MSKQILVDASYPENIQVTVVKDGKLEDLEYSSSKKMITGNIYLAKVTRVEPSLQAAFIDYGGDKHGFISFAEIHSGYYHIPLKYRKDDKVDSDDVTQMQELKAVRVEELKKRQSKKNSEDLEEQSVDVDETTVGGNLEDMPSSDEYQLEKVKKENTEKYKIQEVIKRNQILLVQAIREERGNKGASFTTYISLAGRYCVIMSHSGSKGGVSKKIMLPSERKRLKDVVESMNTSESIGVIIRTVGQGHSEAEIKHDFNYLVRLWNDIRQKTLTSAAPAFIYAEEDILKRIVRDLYDNDTDEIVVQGEESYKEISEIVQMMSAGHDIVVRQHKDKVPLFSKYKINEQIANLYNPVAYTESGSYIVINHTEALISIDVNSGKSTSEKNIEEMALKTNLEAAKEIARQIKLRDLSGIIVIDFIDMMDQRNKRMVERTLKERLYRDKAKVQIGHMSSLGLIEMSRQRLKPSFLESNTVVCSNCCGKGVVKSNNTNAIVILKTIEEEIANERFSELNIYSASDIALYILNHKRKETKAIEDKYNVKLYFLQDPKMSADGFAIEAVSKPKENIEDADYSEDEEKTPQVSGSTDEADSSSKSDDRRDNPRHPQKRYNKNKRYGNKPQHGSTPREKQEYSSNRSSPVSVAPAAAPPPAAKQEQHTDASSSGNKPTKKHRPTRRDKKPKE